MTIDVFGLIDETIADIVDPFGAPIRRKKRQLEEEDRSRRADRLEFEEHRHVRGD